MLPHSHSIQRRGSFRAPRGCRVPTIPFKATVDGSVKDDPMTVNRMEMPKPLPRAACVCQSLLNPGNGCPALGPNGSTGASVGTTRSHLKMHHVLADHERPWHQMRPGWPYQAAGAEAAPCGPPRVWSQWWLWGPGAWWQLPDPSLSQTGLNGPFD